MRSLFWPVPEIRTVTATVEPSQPERIRSGLTVPPYVKVTMSPVWARPVVDAPFVACTSAGAGSVAGGGGGTKAGGGGGGDTGPGGAGGTGAGGGGGLVGCGSCESGGSGGTADSRAPSGDVGWVRGGACSTRSAAAAGA